MLFKKYYWFRYTYQAEGKTSSNNAVCDGHPLIALKKLKEEMKNTNVILDTWYRIPKHIYLNEINNTDGDIL